MRKLNELMTISDSCSVIGSLQHELIFKVDGLCEMIRLRLIQHHILTRKKIFFLRGSRDGTTQRRERLVDDSTEKANHSKGSFSFQAHKHISLSLYLHAQRSPALSISCAKYSKQCVSWVSMFLTNRAARKNPLLK